MNASPELEPPTEAPGGRAGNALVLKSAEFRKRREASWLQLEGLVGRIEKHGTRSLSIDELLHLPLLYRAALSSLAVARSIALDRNLLLYLENLALRAFLSVYGPRLRLWQGLFDFLRRGFPAAVRAARWHLLIALVTLAVGVIAGFALVAVDEAWFSALIPSSYAGGRGPSNTRAELLDKEIFAPWPGAAASFGVFANFLFTHNAVIGIFTFSLGIAAGVPTLLLLAYQGLVLGAFLALHYNRDLSVEFLGWVSIHGVTEIGAVLLCGAGGLVIADKVLFPGRHARVESLSRHGRLAAQIAIGAVLMFFIAAILEGGFRQLVQSTPLRSAIAAMTAAAWLAYFLCGDRERTPP